MYATEDIEYVQELLIVNREYPTGREEDPQAAAPCPHAQTLPSADADTMTAMRDAETPDTTLDEEMEGSQYAMFDELGIWKMHEPTNPWQDDSLHQQSTPTPANNIPAGRLSQKNISTSQSRLRNPLTCARISG